MTLGIIGSGFAAQTIAHAARSTQPPVTVTHVWSPQRDRASRFAHEFGAAVCDSAEQLCGVVDAVAIASPHPTHAHYAGLGLNAGCHVFVEKPFTTDADEGRSLIDAARKIGRVLSVNHFQRFRIPNRSAKALLGSGELGHILGGSCRLWEPPMSRPWQQQRDSVGFTLGYGVHAVDLLRWWLDADIVRVSARECPDAAGVERATLAHLEFASGAVVQLMTGDRRATETGTQVGRAVFETSLLGSRGLLEVDSYGAATVYTPQPRIAGRLPEWTGLDSPTRLAAYALALGQFVASCRGACEPELTGADALRAVEICLALRESATRGGTWTRA
ncbi:Gfo/Idh/MocA family protein [Nocardia gipuzkoensis]